MQTAVRRDVPGSVRDGGRVDLNRPAALDPGSDHELRRCRRARQWYRRGGRSGATGSGTRLVCARGVHDRLSRPGRGGQYGPLVWRCVQPFGLDGRLCCDRHRLCRGRLGGTAGTRIAASSAEARVRDAFFPVNSLFSNKPAMASFCGILVVWAKHVVGPLLIADHVFRVIGRRVHRWLVRATQVGTAAIGQSILASQKKARA
jgi:hypothetical protein